MGLKQFHIFFIATALAMLAFTAYNSLSRVAAGEDGGAMTLAAVAVLSFFAGAGYLRWFLRKHAGRL